MFKNFLMKQMLKRQMKNVPEAEQEKILGAVEKNPDLFMKIAEEVKKKMQSGKDQMAATMEVMNEHKEELRKVMGS
jgi:2-oxo-4-hydroxy-4-carboxy--5-ureidoimidazoline (OHCU) decarboxylase